MADNLMPSEADQARTSAVAQAFFYTLGDVLGGIDGAPRFDSTTVRDDGLLGPVSNQPSVGVGTDGAIYVRGRSGMYERSTASAPAVAASAGGLTITPGLLLLGAVAFFIMRSR